MLGDIYWLPVHICMPNCVCILMTVDCTTKKVGCVAVNCVILVGCVALHVVPKFSDVNLVVA